MAGGKGLYIIPTQSNYDKYAWCGECQEWVLKSAIKNFKCSEGHRVRWRNHYAWKREDEVKRY